MPYKSLETRLNEEGVICAGGYLFELERRGYLRAGDFVPTVALDHPDVLAQVTRDFLRAGSDVALACTYYAHREKLRIIGRQDSLESLNRAALQIAHQVAHEEVVEGRPRALIAGNICNTNIYDPDDISSHHAVRDMFREMIGWAVSEGVDYIQAETLSYLGEAKIALEEIQRAGLPSVVFVAAYADGNLRDATPEDACAELANAGATVVGANCFRGPQTMLPVLKDIRKRVSHTHLGTLPVAYRTTPEHPTMFNLPDVHNTARLPTERTFPDALEGQQCNRYEIAEFTRNAWALGYRFVGVCCGGSVIHHRAVAEALGRSPQASRYSPDMSKHCMYGSDPSLKEHITSFADFA
ncbi:MAG: homocysteine S-methyltransferase family protein [Deinococcota bacterium]